MGTEVRRWHEGAAGRAAARRAAAFVTTTQKVARSPTTRFSSESTSCAFLRLARCAHRAPRPTSKLQATGTTKPQRKQYLYSAEYRAQQEQTSSTSLSASGSGSRTSGGHGRRHGSRPTRLRASGGDCAAPPINLGWFRPDRALRGRPRTFGITTLRKGMSTSAVIGCGSIFAASTKVCVRMKPSSTQSSPTDPRAEALRGGARLFASATGTASSRADVERHLNEYVQQHMGEEYTVKDFRTWGGTLLAAIGLAEHGASESETGRKGGRRGLPLGRREAGKHPGGLPGFLHQSAGDRPVPRRAHDRRFPASPFAHGLGTG